jgi:hypothetical protein
MEESLSHNMGYTPGIFDNIFRWEKLNTEIFFFYWYGKYQYMEKNVSSWNKCSVFRSHIETV